MPLYFNGMSKKKETPFDVSLLLWKKDISFSFQSQPPHNQHL